MSEMIFIDGDFAAGVLPIRKEDGQKGDFGKLLVVGGAIGYTGAPYLAASAAARSGCGLVYLGVPESIWPVEAGKCVSAMPFPLPDSGGMLCEASYGSVVEKLQHCDVLALGPGLGRSWELRKLVSMLLSYSAKPIVLDADGINALEGNLSPLDGRCGRVTILTPHDAEFARLTDLSLADIANGDRIVLARDFAVRHSCVLVLKGHRTAVAAPDGRVFVNTCGGSALSKGGSGDVLTGLIASLLCQGMSAPEASALGVYLHARAGDLLTAQKTAYCVTPSDLIEQGFPLVFRELQ